MCLQGPRQVVQRQTITFVGSKWEPEDEKEYEDWGGRQTRRDEMERASVCEYVDECWMRRIGEVFGDVWRKTSKERQEKKHKRYEEDGEV